MKTPFVFPVAVLFLSFASCSSGGNQQNKSSSDSSTAYVPSAPHETYDVNKIDPSAPVMEFNMEAIGTSMDNMSYSMEEIRVKSGSTVKIHFANKATDPALKHNFFVVKNGMADSVANEAMAVGLSKEYIPEDKMNILFSSPLLDIGKTEDLVFAAPPQGAYQFVCTYPGHAAKMRGRFIVE